MLHLNIYIVIFTALCFETILSKGRHDNMYHYDYVSHANNSSRTERFGFQAFEEYRKQFCNSFCKSANTMLYVANLVCALKCRELYLPSSTSTTPPITSSTTTASTTIPSTTIPSTTIPSTTTPSTTTPSATTPSTTTPSTTTLSTTTPSTTTLSTTTQMMTTNTMAG